MSLRSSGLRLLIQTVDDVLAPAGLGSVRQMVTSGADESGLMSKDGPGPDTETFLCRRDLGANRRQSNWGRRQPRSDGNPRSGPMDGVKSPQTIATKYL